MADKLEVTANLLESLSCFRLEDLDPDWVKKIWEGDFLENEELPLGFSDLHVETIWSEVLSETVVFCKRWLQLKREDGETGLWVLLVDNNIPTKSLIALLYSLIDDGTKKQGCESKEMAILAADLYFCLLAVPGSQAFKVFHPMLFQMSVDVLHIANVLVIGKRKRSNEAKKRSTSKRGRQKRSRPTAEDSDEEEDNEDDSFSSSDSDKIKTALLEMMRDLLFLLQQGFLKEGDQTSHHMIQRLVEMTRQDPEFWSPNFHRTVHLKTVSSLGEFAYLGLLLLSKSTSDKHLERMMNTIFKYIYPNLLMVKAGNNVAVQPIPKPMHLIKDHTLEYIIHVINTSGENVLPSVRILIQHLCAKVPDKADYRAKVSQVIFNILQVLPGKDYASMIEWIYRYSRNVKISYRVFGLEIFSLVLQEQRQDRYENIPENLLVYTSHKFLLQVIIARCSDRAASVRAKALTCFAACTNSSHPFLHQIMVKLFTPSPGSRKPTRSLERTLISPDKLYLAEANENVATTGSPLVDGADNTIIRTDKDTDDSSEENDDNCDELKNISLDDCAAVMSMLKSRSGDEKVNVRKAAVQALENILALDPIRITEFNLTVLSERCTDPALSIRKQAMQSLTALLDVQPNNKMLVKIWLDGVLPLVMDRESSAQEKCLEIMEEMILQNIVSVSGSILEKHKLTWNILRTLAGNEGQDYKRYLLRACQFWSKQGKIKPTLLNALQTHLNHPDNKQAAWLLIAEFSPFVNKFDPTFVLNSWNNIYNSEEDSPFLKHVLHILGHCARRIPKDCVPLLTDQLKQMLNSFSCPPEQISILIITLTKLCEAQYSSKEGAKPLIDIWCVYILKACDEYLSSVILDEQQDRIMNEELIVRHLFTLGEIAQICPTKIPKRIFMLVQSLVAASNISSSGSDIGFSSLQSSQQNSQNSQTVLSQFKGSNMSAKIRAHAFVTLGKLCLQNEDIAKKCIAALARELATATEVPIRNNVIIIMTDLCVRYTTLVDRYVPNIAACLKDPASLIRKQTLTLLTHLLQEDYVKWKGALFFRYIVSLVDTDKSIQQFAEFCLIHLLLQRHPQMFFMHFIECIFHFNSYHGHKVYNKFVQTEREKDLFSLKGEENKSKRLTLYQFMLEYMTDEHRFNLTAKLCQEILAAIVDGIIPLDKESELLLKDALVILCCKEIKLASLRAPPPDDGDEVDLATAVIQTAKKTFITQVVKKNVIENIVPVVIGLKHMLEKEHSPLQKDLMMFLKELMQDYKTEVKEIMSADKQLANEIEFDLRRFALEQEEGKTPTRKTPQKGTTTPKNIHSASKVVKTPALPASGLPKTPIRAPVKTPSQLLCSAPNTPRTPGQPLCNIPRTPGQPLNNTPRTPGQPLCNNSKTPAQFRTPSKAVPNTPRTPNKLLLKSPALVLKHRKSTLNALTVLKSAKKILDDDKMATPPPASILRKPRIPGTVNRVRFEIPPNFQTISPEQQSRPRPKNRAISTPDATINDITLDVTGIPPSPIPTSLPIRLYSNSGESNSLLSTGSNKRNKSLQDLVCMFSPDKPQPKPRRWQIKPLSSGSEQELQQSDRQH